MKKRVAVFANGWSNEYLKLVFEGMRKKAKESNVDLYAFVNYSAGSADKPDNMGESSIFELPDMNQFDGAILLGNVINISSEREYLNKEILKSHIPAVCLEYEMEGIPCLGTDTYSGVYELARHVIEEHGVRNVIYVSGPEGNRESQIRMMALKNALAKAGALLPPENVIQADWSYFNAYDFVCDWLKNHKDLPDAFICANDEMATGVCMALDCFGIKVPEQVIVTGCDCDAKSQELYPILTTVAREWDKLGYEGLELVLRQIEGEKVPMLHEYSSVPVWGESCGCKVKEHRKEFRRRSIVRNYRGQRESSINEWHLRQIDELLVKMTSVQSLKDHLGWNFSYNHTFEGENFAICLNDRYFSEEKSGGIKRGGYTDKMEVYVHLQNGKAKPGVMFDRKELLPQFDLPAEQSHLYLFVPLHMEERSIGYVVFADEVTRLYEQTLYIWMRHVSQDMERVRQNIRLERMNAKLIEVSMTDALTGLKNRTGYDALAFPCLQKCQREGKYGAMLFADINRMKRINDKYGHLQGDIAIRTVADAIKMTMPADWIAVRFGGDEFIMVGECRDKEEAEEIEKQLYENLEQIKSGRDISFPLSASFGAVVMEPGEHYSLEEYLRKADEAMYQMKQKAHAAE